MKRLLLLIAALCACALPSHAQSPIPSYYSGPAQFAGAPTGGCVPWQLAENAATGHLFDCFNSSWNDVSGGGGSGTVTSVSGTTNQVNIATGTTTPVASLSSTLLVPGTFTNSTAGAASTSPVLLNGTIFPGGSGTTTFPYFYMNHGAAPTAFSVNGTLVGLNTPSGFTGNAIDVFSNGATRIFRVDSTGAVLAAGAIGAANGTYGSTISKYNNISTLGNGVPAIYGQADLTAQTAAKAATTLNTPTNSGLMRVVVYLKVTTAAGTSSTLGGATGVKITYTDATDSVAQSVTVVGQTEAGVAGINNAGNATTSVFTGSVIINAKSAVAVQYAIDYTSSGTAMAYEAHLKLEAL